MSKQEERETNLSGVHSLMEGEKPQRDLGHSPPWNRTVVDYVARKLGVENPKPNERTRIHQILEELSEEAPITDLTDEEGDPVELNYEDWLGGYPQEEDIISYREWIDENLEKIGRKYDGS